MLIQQKGREVNIPNYDSLDDIEKELIDWQYRLCGDFRQALWEAICRADDNNLARLRLGFPNQVDGYIRYTRESEYWARVQEKAGVLVGG